jgi:hypothetical protein
MMNPSTGEIMEGVFTARTTVSSFLKFVKLSRFTTWTESLMVFEAFFQQIFSGPVFAGNQLVVSI